MSDLRKKLMIRGSVCPALTCWDFIVPPAAVIIRASTCTLANHPRQINLVVLGKRLRIIFYELSELYQVVFELILQHNLRQFLATAKLP
jgi:hypothetical protein